MENIKKMTKKEVSLFLKQRDLIGKPIKVVSKDHYTLNQAGVSVHSKEYHHLVGNNALFITIGLLLEIKLDSLVIASNWVIFKEKTTIEELHKVLKGDIIQIRKLSVENPN